VKLDRRLGEMPAVKTVPEKQREDVCPKSHAGNSAYIPKLQEKLTSVQNDYKNGEENMNEGTEEEEKKNAHPT
jgi:hypothetical protein